MTLVPVATFVDVNEANVVRAKLATFGIEAVVEADAGSSSLPVLDQISGVRVLVRDHDFAEAMEALQKMLPAPPPD